MKNKIKLKKGEILFNKRPTGYSFKEEFKKDKYKCKVYFNKKKIAEYKDTYSMFSFLLRLDSEMIFKARKGKSADSETE